jgi:hypothetical protein
MFSRPDGAASGRVVDARQYPQQGGLARAIVANDAQALAAVEAQVDAIQASHDDVAVVAGGDAPTCDSLEHPVLEREAGGIEDGEVDLDVLQVDVGFVGHSQYAIRLRKKP